MGSKVKHGVALVLAIGLAYIASVVKESPHIVFKVPKIGWLLGGLLGYGLPGYINTNVLAKCYNEEKCPWLKSGDVVIDSCAKCGTNWMMTAVHELRTWDQPYLRDFRDILDIAPWVELTPHPEADIEHPEEEWDVYWNSSDLKFQEFKSHLPPFHQDSKGIRTSLIPVRERRDVKFLIMVRDPVDIVHSSTVFLPSIKPEWNAVWGDIPAMSSSISTMLKILAYGGSSSSPFHFFNSWMEYAGEENVLILHYANVLKDTKKSLKIIADFVGLENIPEEVFDEINERVGFKYMKKRGDRYMHLAGVNKTVPMISSSTLIKKGGIGSSKDAITPEERRMVEDFAKQALGSRNYDLMSGGFEPFLSQKL